MKKSISLLLLASLVALFVSGCGGTGPPPTSAPTEPTPTPVPPTATSVPAEPSTATPVPVEPTTPPAPEPPEPAEETPAAPLEISSSAFEPGGEIPVQYSCDGENLSPRLEWSGVPEGTESLALLVDDPDSEPPGFVHWVVYSIPPTSAGLPEGVSAQATLPDGTLQGTNDFALFVGEGETFPGGAPINRIGYDGPCPGNKHRYVFTLYALDTVLHLQAEATMAERSRAMEGHVLNEADLIAVYTPQR